MGPSANRTGPSAIGVGFSTRGITTVASDVIPVASHATTFARIPTFPAHQRRVSRFAHSGAAIDRIEA
jgi:hypothetical protein